MRHQRPALLHAVAASPHVFPLPLLPAEIVTNDLIIPPARHPAILLWTELGRGSYLLTQRELFGGLEEMGKQYAGLPTELRWRRYTVALRSGRLHAELFRRLELPLDDRRLGRADHVATPATELR